MGERIPQRLKYNNYVPPGLTARVVQMRYQPSTAGPVIAPGDQIRYLINQSGYWDPYKTQISCEVDFSSLDDWVIAQVDNSAQSLFRSLIISCRGKELERIMEYDVLAAMLHDMQVPIHKRYTKEMQGLGYSNYSNQTFAKIEGGLSLAHSKAALYTGRTTAIGTKPYIFDQEVDVTAQGLATTTRAGVANINPYPYNSSIDGIPTFSDVNTNGFLETVCALEHRYWGPSKGVTPLTGDYSGFKDYFDATHVITGNPSVFQQSALERDTNQNNTILGTTTSSFRQLGVQWVNVSGTNYLQAARDSRLAYISDIQGIDETFGSGTNVGRALFRQDGTNGVDILTDSDLSYGATTKQIFNYAFSNASFEPQFTNGKDVYVNYSTVPPTYQMSYNPVGAGWSLAPISQQFWKPCVVGGQLTRSSSNTGAFLFPLLSGIFGAYMPTSHYKLLPMKLFPDLTFEVQINPWFIFTSGYTNSNTNGSNNQPKRAFTIKRLEIITDQYILDDPDVDRMIMASYSQGDGMRLHTNSFWLGPIYNIIKNQIPATMQLNLGFESLKNLFWCYLPQDFQNWSWCRRNFRLSHNVVKEQVNIEPNQYPSQPPLANAGNILPLPSQGTMSTIMYRHPNNELVFQLYKAFGKHADLAEDCFVNNVNFSVNNRAYAPDNSSSNVAGNPDSMGYTYQESFCQYGWPLLHENRMVGRAIYGLSLEPFAHDKVVINGVNTFGKRPFEITQEFMSDVQYLFNRNSICLSFAHYDLLLKVTPDSIEVIGRS